MRDKLYSFVGNNPFWVILVCITFAIVAGMGAQKLEFKQDYRVFFSEENPQLTAFETMQKVLPGIEKFIVPDRESGGLLNLLNLNPGVRKGASKW